MMPLPGTPRALNETQHALGEVISKNAGGIDTCPFAPPTIIVFPWAMNVMKY